MAIPTSGQIAASAINREFRRSSSAQISIYAAETGGYGAINQASTLRPDGRTPMRFSEWRGYDHSASINVFPFDTGFDVSSPDRACVNVTIGRITRVTANQPDWPLATFLWNNISGTTTAPRGYYAEAGTQIVRYWNGTGSFFSTQGCRV